MSETKLSIGFHDECHGVAYINRGTETIARLDGPNAVSNAHAIIDGFNRPAALTPAPAIAELIEAAKAMKEAIEMITVHRRVSLYGAADAVRERLETSIKFADAALSNLKGT